MRARASRPETEAAPGFFAQAKKLAPSPRRRPAIRSPEGIGLNFNPEMLYLNRIRNSEKLSLQGYFNLLDLFSGGRVNRRQAFCFAKSLTHLLRPRASASPLVFFLALARSGGQKKHISRYNNILYIRTRNMLFFEKGRFSKKACFVSYNIYYIY